MKRTLLLIMLFSTVGNLYCQEVSWYNTDSLLEVLSKKEKINQILIAAETIFNDAKIDTGNISLNAFKVAYLEKQMIDKRRIHIRHRRRYKNKKIISVVDYTKLGNKLRFATIDLKHHKLLFDTLISQGSGRTGHKNDKFHFPVFFSNMENTEVSSLGLILAKRARQTDNPCHLCKYAITNPHKDVIILEGLEKGINNNVKRRDIVIHTTGSYDLSSDDAKEELGITDTNYHVVLTECKCYHTGDDGNVKGISAYLSACGLADNHGFPGQSNGCLVLPEDHHIEIIKTIKRRSLIFIYSNVINDGYDYFRDSPIIRKTLKYANR